jgi:hypothetical protein
MISNKVVTIFALSALIVILHPLVSLAQSQPPVSKSCGFSTVDITNEVTQVFQGRVNSLLTKVLAPNGLFGALLLIAIFAAWLDHLSGQFDWKSFVIRVSVVLLLLKAYTNTSTFAGISGTFLDVIESSATELANTLRFGQSNVDPARSLWNTFYQMFRNIQQIVLQQSTSGGTTSFFSHIPGIGKLVEAGAILAYLFSPAGITTILFTLTILVVAILSYVLDGGATILLLILRLVGPIAICFGLLRSTQQIAWGWLQRFIEICLWRVVYAIFIVAISAVFVQLGQILWDPVKFSNMDALTGMSCMFTAMLLSIVVAVVSIFMLSSIPAICASLVEGRSAGMGGTVSLLLGAAAYAVLRTAQNAVSNAFRKGNSGPGNDPNPDYGTGRSGPRGPNPNLVGPGRKGLPVGVNPNQSNPLKPSGSTGRGQTPASSVSGPTRVNPSQRTQTTPNPVNAAGSPVQVTAKQSPNSNSNPSPLAPTNLQSKNQPLTDPQQKKAESSSSIPNSQQGLPSGSLAVPQPSKTDPSVVRYPLQNRQQEKTSSTAARSGQYSGEKEKAPDTLKGKHSNHTDNKEAQTLQNRAPSGSERGAENSKKNDPANQSNAVIPQAETAKQNSDQRASGEKALRNSPAAAASKENEAGISKDAANLGAHVSTKANTTAVGSQAHLPQNQQASQQPPTHRSLNRDDKSNSNSISAKGTSDGSITHDPNSRSRPPSQSTLGNQGDGSRLSESNKQSVSMTSDSNGALDGASLRSSKNGGSLSAHVPATPIKTTGPSQSHIGQNRQGLNEATMNLSLNTDITPNSNSIDAKPTSRGSISHEPNSASRHSSLDIGGNQKEGSSLNESKKQSLTTESANSNKALGGLRSSEQDSNTRRSSHLEGRASGNSAEVNPAQTSLPAGDSNHRARFSAEPSNEKRNSSATTQPGRQHNHHASGSPALSGEIGLHRLRQERSGGSDENRSVKDTAFRNEASRSQAGDFKKGAGSISPSGSREYKNRLQAVRGSHSSYLKDRGADTASSVPSERSLPSVDSDSQNSRGQFAEQKVVQPRLDAVAKVSREESSPASAHPVSGHGTFRTDKSHDSIRGGNGHGYQEGGRQTLGATENNQYGNDLRPDRSAATSGPGHHYTQEGTEATAGRSRIVSDDNPSGARSNDNATYTRTEQSRQGERSSTVEGRGQYGRISHSDPSSAQTPNVMRSSNSVASNRLDNVDRDAQVSQQSRYSKSTDPGAVRPVSDHGGSNRTHQSNDSIGARNVHDQQGAHRLANSGSNRYGNDLRNDRSQAPSGSTRHYSHEGSEPAGAQSRNVAHYNQSAGRSNENARSSYCKTEESGQGQRFSNPENDAQHGTMAHSSGPSSAQSPNVMPSSRSAPSNRLDNLSGDFQVSEQSRNSAGSTPYITSAKEASESYRAPHSHPGYEELSQSDKAGSQQPTSTDFKTEPARFQEPLSGSQEKDSRIHEQMQHSANESLSHYGDRRFDENPHRNYSEKEQDQSQRSSYDEANTSRTENNGITPERRPSGQEQEKSSFTPNQGSSSHAGSADFAGNDIQHYSGHSSVVESTPLSERVPSQIESSYSWSDSYGSKESIAGAVGQSRQSDSSTAQPISYGNSDPFENRNSLFERYSSSRDAIGKAVEHARERSFENDSSIKAAEQFFSRFNPDKLYSNGWWIKKIEALENHDGGSARDIASSAFKETFSPAIPTREAVESIAQFTGDAPITEYFSGSGYWASQLENNANIQVFATDVPSYSADVPDDPSDNRKFVDVSPIDSNKIEVPHGHTIMMTSRPGDSDARSILDRMEGGQKLVLFDSGNEANPSSDFQKYLTEAFDEKERLPLPAFDSPATEGTLLNEHLRFLVKKEEAPGKSNNPDSLNNPVKTSFSDRFNNAAKSFGTFVRKIVTKNDA